MNTYYKQVAKAKRRLHSRKERKRLRAQAPTARAAREAMLDRTQAEFLAVR